MKNIIYKGFEKTCYNSYKSIERLDSVENMRNKHENGFVTNQTQTSLPIFVLTLWELGFDDFWVFVTL